MANLILPPDYTANSVIDMFMHQALTQLEINTRTQHVWPREIYRGFHAVNEHRKRMGQWYATGEGAKSFEGYIVNADENTGKFDILFSFNEYLRYVDIGVGKGVKASDVDRNKDVKFKKRYINKWDRAEGKSHRPAIMPELRHFAERTRKFLRDFYGFKGEMAVLHLVPKGLGSTE